ncbi:MAG: hypothetical protein E4H14_01090 [Candidatus Thorarchaeota archaeon]|nr:MAG: hypothetical protein E4H14_01090 [Candidatus Thorarchaeota archaeon]
MSDTSGSIMTFSRLLEESDNLSYTQILLGLFGSAVILVLSTWGVLSLLNFAQIFIVDLANLTRYTMYMILGSILSTVIAIIIVVAMVRWPRIVNLPLRIHRFAKRGTGEYFLSPEPPDQSWRTVIRRSLYGSILVVGIALTILGFDLMVADTAQVIFGGTFLMLVSIIVLPITLLEFYFGPWLIKDSGLFHLDERDRSLSNVGDDLEDILEFFAGVDILFILLELAISVGPTAPWLPVFVILIPLGPLFSIVMNFTFIFMIFKKKATLSMMEFLSTRYDVPDILSSPDYIRSRVIALVERDLMMNLEIPETLPPETTFDVILEEPDKVDSADIDSESINEDGS